jgi:hypothetical protein
LLKEDLRISTFTNLQLDFFDQKFGFALEQCWA